jgi:hypothetical protein
MIRKTGRTVPYILFLFFEVKKPTEDEVELCDLSVPHFLVHGVAVISVRLTAESLLPSQNHMRLDLDLLSITTSI